MQRYDLLLDLRKEWNQLEIERKSCIDSVEKKLIKQKQEKIEQQLDCCSEKIIDTVCAELFIGTTESVFDSESSYVGITSHGRCLGDGNYWFSNKRPVY